MTHNTDSCSKYKKDGTKKPVWGSKLSSNSAGKYKKPDNSYAQLQKHFEKLEKPVKKVRKVLLLITIVAIVIPTLNRELGRVVWGN